MKKCFYLFTMMALPATNLLAQPVVNHMEQYVLGTVTKLLNCSTVGVTPGNNGASQNWNMLDLMPAHMSNPAIDTYTHYVVPNSVSTLYPNATIVDSSNELGTTRVFLNQSGTQTYIVGSVVNSAIQAFDNSGLQRGKQPLSYLDHYTSTYTGNNQSSGVAYFRGTYDVTVDGWGTLQLPSGTFNNVLRVAIVQDEVDSSQNQQGNENIVTEYDWYDNDHSAPLLTIRSLSTNGGNPNVTVKYLVSQTPLLDVKTVANTQSALEGCFNNNELVLNHNFKQGTSYHVSLTNLAGQKVYNKMFVATGDKTAHLYPENLPCGMYIVSLSETNKPGISTLKVVKQ